jgi:hypothetical protein
MLGTIKKKKVVDYSEQEKLKDILRKPVDVAKLNNDKLRPWTVNPSTEGILSTEIRKLDKTIVVTSPQMSAGDIGYSVLDRKVQEIDDFRESLKHRAKLNPYKTYYDNYLFVNNTIKPPMKISGSKRGDSGSKSFSNTTMNNTIIDNGHRSNNISRNEEVMDSQENEFESFSNNNISNTRTFGDSHFGYGITADRKKSDDITSEIDEEYVSKLQRMIHTKSMSHQHSLKVPLPTVQFKPFKTPAVFPVSTTDFQRLKTEMKSFPKPTTIHLNHRNQLLMISMVNNQHHHDLQEKSRQSLLFQNNRTLRATSSLPDIKSSYYHFPPPSSS